MNHQQTYGHLRADILARHFALGKFWRANHFTNINLLGELGGQLPPAGQTRSQACFKEACVPRRAPFSTTPGINQPPVPVYDTPEKSPPTRRPWRWASVKQNAGVCGHTITPMD